ncbi:peptidylprolyl isomerase [Rhodoplanes sp. Z2-YC6860]|uniref:peptidylprolyl isomerase n=1 Tax=Rhodoplanes sp. Z2-YC6860 TaxID=674703 RepID=UPI00078D6D55|nr:SurA N-terminal domain-containing protein [Rhodoplanes sp. Z2-YC6860]AMN42363.1 peptidyl-prolyl cis-trans isomerase [Rhodoplanes sp. Z2-YC6860]
MLRGIHKASSNWIGRAVMGVVLGLIAISFGIWGIGDIFRGFGQSTLAKVGGTEIRIETFRQQYQDRLQQLGRQFNRPILPDQARALGLDRQFLSQMIADTAIDEKTRSLRLGASDAEIARQVTDMPAFKGINGQFDRARFEAVIRNGGYNEQRFLAEQRRNLVRQQLVNTISDQTFVPKTSLEVFNRFQNEERTVEYVLLGKAQAGDIPEPSAEALAKYFEERKVVFRAPETRKVTIVTLKPEDIAGRIVVSEDDLKKTYASRKARYETPERRKIRQIVFPNMDEAKAASEKLSSGTSFDDLAKERGLKDTDIDLGNVTKAAVVDREVGNAAFALNNGEVSKPIEGRFGIAIVKVDAIEPAATKSFEEVSADLKKELSLDRAKNETTSVQEKVEDERLGGASLADAAKKFGLMPRVIDSIDRSGKDASGQPVADLPEGVDLLSAIFSADVHGENEPLRLPNNAGYVWYDVDSISAAHDRKLDEVKDDVLTHYRDDEVTKALRAKATALVDKIKGGTSFADAAKADDLKVEWRPGIKRGNTPPPLSAAAVAEVFRTPKDGVGTVEGTTPAERIVFRVSEIKVPPLDAESADSKRIDEALRQRNAEDIIAQYVARLRDDVGVSVNYNLLSQDSSNNPQY